MRFGLLATAIIFIAGCAGPQWDEVARTGSPSGTLDAVLLETSGGATTTYQYAVRLVKKDGGFSESVPAATLVGAARNEQAYGVNLRWESSTVLRIEYQSATSTTTSQAPLIVNGIPVTVVLHPGVIDPNAPPGGMYFNLRG